MTIESKWTYDDTPNNLQKRDSSDNYDTYDLRNCPRRKNADDDRDDARNHDDQVVMIMMVMLAH